MTLQGFFSSFLLGLFSWSFLAYDLSYDEVKLEIKRRNYGVKCNHLGRYKILATGGINSDTDGATKQRDERGRFKGEATLPSQVLSCRSSTPLKFLRNAKLINCWSQRYEFETIWLPSVRPQPPWFFPSISNQCFASTDSIMSYP